MSNWPRSAFAAVLKRCAAERLGLTRLELAPDQLERLWSSVRSQPMAASIALPAELGGGFVPWDMLVEAITVRETYFFRHPEQLELIRKHVLTEERTRGLPLFRAWSAGCASGEEAYSLAIMCHQEGMLNHTYILGTDVCQAAIDTARAASYRDWSLRGLPAEQQGLHFERRGPLHRVRDHLRRRVSFQILNLTEPRYPAAADGTAGLSLICCRNVFMFLEQACVHQIAARLFDALAPGGFLLTGPSDPNLSGPLAWDVLVTKAGLLYRKPPSVPSTTSKSEAARHGESRVKLLPLQPRPGLPEPDPEWTHLIASPYFAAEPVVASDGASSVEPTAAVRRAWNVQGAAPALVRCNEALTSAPNACELHYLRAMLLWELGQQTQAVSSMRTVLYLDRDQPVAHFGLAALYERSGDLEAAHRSYRNVLAYCESLPADAVLPLGDGICAAGMRAAAELALQRLRSGKVSA